MSAFRDFSNETPQVIAQKYRLNQKREDSKHASIKRKPKQPDIPEISIEVIDSDTYSQQSWRSLEISSDEDFDPFEDDGDVLFESQNAGPYQRSSQELLMYVYETACKRHKILPLTAVKTGLLKQTLSCRFINLTKFDCLCICYALCNDRFVERLDFQQNGMGPEPAHFFAEVIENSSFLTHVRIVDNDLRSAGIRPICDAIRQSTKITFLDLSGNGLVESDGECLQKLIEESDVLTELHLGQNKLMDQGVRRICEALKKNDTLEVLDLSWNHIRLKGAEAIGEALAENNSLLKVNLEWNGLHQDGAFGIARALQKNESLIELNVVCNRLSEYCLAEIIKGLDSNTSLEILRFGQNQVTSRGAFAILKHIKENTSSKIAVLDFGNQEVHDNFEELYLEMKKERDIEVLYGNVWQRERSSLANSGVDDDEVALLSCNPLTVLMECMRLQNMRLLDFFKSLDTDKSQMICINELCDGMLKIGIPIRRHILLKLLTRLDKDNNGKLDYGEMVEAQNIHRNNLRKIFAAASDIEFERTEIGKVTTILRKVMNKNLIMKTSDNDRRQGRLGSRSNTPSPLPMEDLKISSPKNKRNGRITSGRRAEIKQEKLQVPGGSRASSRVSSASSYSSNGSSASTSSR